jgi:hypothetical protein
MFENLEMTKVMSSQTKSRKLYYGAIDKWINLMKSNEKTQIYALAAEKFGVDYIRLYDDSLIKVESELFIRERRVRAEIEVARENYRHSIWNENLATEQVYDAEQKLLHHIRL